jgi:hypothetical protein
MMANGQSEGLVFAADVLVCRELRHVARRHVLMEVHLRREPDAAGLARDPRRGDSDVSLEVLHHPPLVAVDVSADGAAVALVTRQRFPPGML